MGSIPGRDVFFLFFIFEKMGKQCSKYELTAQLTTFSVCKPADMKPSYVLTIIIETIWATVAPCQDEEVPGSISGRDVFFFIFIFEKGNKVQQTSLATFSELE